MCPPWRVQQHYLQRGLGDMMSEQGEKKRLPTHHNGESIQEQNSLVHEWLPH